MQCSHVTLVHISSLYTAATCWSGGGKRRETGATGAHCCGKGLRRGTVLPTLTTAWCRPYMCEDHDSLSWLLPTTSPTVGCRQTARRATPVQYKPQPQHTATGSMPGPCPASHPLHTRAVNASHPVGVPAAWPWARDHGVTTATAGHSSAHRRNNLRFGGNHARHGAAAMDGGPPYLAHSYTVYYTHVTGRP